MGNHATLAPSSAKRWMACPGSVALIATLPAKERDTPSFDSDWGTACHEALATCLDDGIQPMSLLGKAIEVQHEHFPSYIHTLTEEDVSNIGIAHNYVLERMAEYGTGALVFIEERMEAGANFRGHVFDPEQMEVVEKVTPFDNCWGTSDVAMVGRGYAEIVDYKNGTWHVDEEDNEQMLLYLLGLLKRLDPNTHHVQRARLTIVQPRSRLVASGEAEAVRTWEFPVDEFVADWAVKFGDAAREAAKANPTRVPGEATCKFCPAKGICPEVAKASIAALTGAPEPTADADTTELDTDLVAALTKPADALTHEQLARVLDAEPLIRSWLKAVHEQALGLMKKGEKLPGFKLVRGRRDRSWEEDEDAMLKKFGNWNRIGDDGKAAGKLKKDSYLIQSVISPAQAEKVIKPQVTPKTWQNIEKLIKLSDGKPTIAAETDRREAMVIKSSEDAFAEAAAPQPTLPDFLQ